MRLLVGIDDTDSVDSDHGTGRVSRDLGATLETRHDVEWVGSVRQQFLVDPRVPYTTHNSAACLWFEADESTTEAGPEALIEGIVDDAGTYLTEVMADVADPGLCVADAAAVPETVTAFGRLAQTEVVAKAAAYETAAAADVVLDEYGGTGDGVIGALGSVGLTAAGDRGRFIAYGNIRDYGPEVAVARLTDDGIRVVDGAGEDVSEGTVNTHDWVRPQLRNGQPTLPVEPDGDRLKPANLD